MTPHAGVGLIGAGLLGSAVARRWIESGFEVTGYDTDPERAAALAAIGGRAAGSAREVFAACRRVALVLPEASVSAGVLAGVRPLAPGTIVIDMTTGDPDTMAACGAALESEGAAYLDATVGGSSRQAREGAAIVMAGGPRAAFDACRDLLECFAARLFYMGAAGNGARMKLATNLVLGLNRAALAEGLALARACGLDLEQALEVLRAGPAWSRAMDVKGRKMITGDFTPEARLSQHRKDVDLILAEARKRAARTPLSRVHRKLLAQLERRGLGGADNSAIIRAYFEETEG